MVAYGLVPVSELADREWRALLHSDPERGWRMFVEAYTPVVVSLVERAGVGGRDEVTDVYVRVCERLAANGCDRLRAHDPAKGPLVAWLTVIVRHAVVDWVRSRAGRRRLFGVLEALDAADRRVFELYYWERLRPSEIAGWLETELGRVVTLGDVLDALHRIQSVLSDRQRGQLMSSVMRARRAASLDSDDVPVPESPEARPDERLRSREIDAELSRALRQIPAEDAAILRLLFVQGWSRQDVVRALGLDDLSAARVKGILTAVRSALVPSGLAAGDAAAPGLRFLEDESR